MDVREEVASIVLSRPLNGVSPTVLRRLGDDAVVHNEWKVLLRLKGGDSLDQCVRGCGGRITKTTYHLDRRQVFQVWVREHGNLSSVRRRSTRWSPFLTFRAFIFLKSIPTSRVTPSPNLKFDAATYRTLSHLRTTDSYWIVTHLKGVLFACW